MSPRILVVGGSMGGLFAAVLLGRAGFDVTVTERSAHGLEGRGAGLVGQSEVFDILREVGVEHLARVGVTAHERIYLDRSDAIIHRQRTPQTQLSWDILFRTFRERVPDARYRIQDRAVQVRNDASGVRVTYADGHEETADLVIGADGIGSLVREAVSGPHSRPSYVGYVTWRGLVPETEMPEVARRQLFERFSFYDAPGVHVLGYLVPGADGSTEVGRRRYNWVWYRRHSHDELSRVLVDRDGISRPFSIAPGRVRPEVVDSLKRDAAEALPPSLAQAVAAEGTPFVHAIFDYAPPRMVKGRVALLGDAVRGPTAHSHGCGQGGGRCLRAA